MQREEAVVGGDELVIDGGACEYLRLVENPVLEPDKGTAAPLRTREEVVSGDHHLVIVDSQDRLVGAVSRSLEGVRVPVPGRVAGGGGPHSHGPLSDVQQRSKPPPALRIVQNLGIADVVTPASPQ